MYGRASRWLTSISTFSIWYIEATKYIHCKKNNCLFIWFMRYSLATDSPTDIGPSVIGFLLYPLGRERKKRIKR